MTVAVDDIVRINAVVSFQGQEYENVHHFKTIANASPNDQAFMDAVLVLIAAAYANVQNHQSNLLQYQRIEGQNITQDVLLPATNWTGNPVGDSAFDALPAQVTANVFWPTLRPKTRCTSYIPAFTETANNATGGWNTAAKDDLQLFGDALKDAGTQAGVTVQKGAYNVVAARYTPLISAVVPTDSRTQRRRRLGVGI